MLGVLCCFVGVLGAVEPLVQSPRGLPAVPASTSACLLLAHRMLSAVMPLASTMVWLQLRLQLMLRSAPAAAASTKSLEECAHSCSRTSAPPTSASAHRMSSSCAATALIAEQQAASARSCLEHAHACTRATPPPASMMAWRSAALPAGERGGGASVTRHKRGEGLRAHRLRRSWRSWRPRPPACGFPRCERTKMPVS